MIKHVFLLLAVPFIGIAIASAQCTPDYQGTVAGLDPDSLPHATYNKSYSQIIQMLVPSDTMITEFGGQPLPQPLAATVNYVDLLDLDLGTLTTYSFTYATKSQDPNGDNTHFPGGSEGCVLFSAPASNGAPIGTYPTAIYVSYNVDIPALGIFGYDVKDTVVDYTLVVEAEGTGISVVNNNQFLLIQNYPNPFNGNTKVDFISPKTDTYTFEVINILGEVIYSQQVNAHRGLNSISFDASKLSKGTYTYSVGSKESKSVKIMTIN